jgi:TRAP-type C4-dicarboxylate transport system substrate-binding protein
VGCSSDDVADKAGNPPPPVTLTLVTSEVRGRPGGDMVDRFVSAVDELSGGRVTIAATFDHPPDQPRAWDQVNLDALRADEFDLAFVPARAWHSEGVTTLEPLQLPFVIETDEQADLVATDPALSAALMSGLDDIGVTGLGLFPEGLRHVARLDGTPISPSGDLAGLTVRAPLSTTTWAVLEGLGADVVDRNGTELAAAIGSGDVTAAETSLALAPGLEGTGTPSVLANIPLYTKFNVLAINDETMNDLDAETATIVREATAAALTATLSERPHEDVALAAACDAGLHAVFATAGDRQATRDRLTAAVDGIVAESGIERLVEQVHAVAGDDATEELSACPGTSPVDLIAPRDPADLRPEAGELPNGTYRFTIDPEMILAAYPSFNRPVEEYSHTFTVDLDDGHWSLASVGPDGEQVRFYESIYEVRGDVATFAIASGADARVPIAVRWRWMVLDDGSLSFEPLDRHDEGERVDYSDLLTIPLWEPIG